MKDPDALVRLTQEQYQKLLSENARYREALQKIYIPDPVHYDGAMAFAYKIIAREALRGE